MNTDGSEEGLESGHSQAKKQGGPRKTLAYPQPLNYIGWHQGGKGKGPLWLRAQARAWAGQDLPIREQVKAT